MYPLSNMAILGIYVRFQGGCILYCTNQRAKHILVMINDDFSALVAQGPRPGPVTPKKQKKHLRSWMVKQDT